MIGSRTIPIKDLVPNTGQIPGVPRNPRIIRDERFAKLVRSLKEDPEMLELRELLVYEHDGAFVVLGGNMRLKALKQLGEKEAPCKVIPAGWPAEKLRAIVTKDNVAYGDFDWEAIVEEWDRGELDEWGLEFPGAEIAGIDAPEIADGPKPEYQQMTFTLHDSQAETVKAALDKAKASGASESDVNENSNGNALAYACAAFLNG